MRYAAKKRLGQHFLVDGNICRRIVKSVNLRPEDVVLEIGPGRGALTRALLESSGRVLTVEVDKELADGLNEEFAGELAEGRLDVTVGDVLKTDLEDLLEQRMAGRQIRVFGNLPYNIATAIVQQLIACRSRIRDMTLMLQREVVDRILSPPGHKEYGYLSVIVQYHCEGEKLFHLPPGVFRPVPKVTSTVVHLKVRDRPPVEVKNETVFFELISALFKERRKTLLNNLKRAAVRFNLEMPERLFEQAGIDPVRRAETLTLEEFARLANRLGKTVEG